MDGRCDNFCNGCIYKMFLGGGKFTPYCNYIVETGHPRPCPAGTGCTVKVTRKQRKRAYEPYKI